MEKLGVAPQLDVEATSTVERTHLDRAEESLGQEAVRDLEVQDRSYEWLCVDGSRGPVTASSSSPESVRGLSGPV